MLGILRIRLQTTFMTIILSNLRVIFLARVIFGVVWRSEFFWYCLVCVLGVSRLVNWSVDAAMVADEVCIRLHKTTIDGLLCREGKQEERKIKKKRDDQKQEER
jgi:hypothetical protein